MGPISHHEATVPRGSVSLANNHLLAKHIVLGLYQQRYPLTFSFISHLSTVLYIYDMFKRRKAREVNALTHECTHENPWCGSLGQRPRHTMVTQLLRETIDASTRSI